MTKKAFEKRKNAGYCPSSKVFFKADCECGHSFLVSGSCNREICSVCGNEDGPLHRQKIRRWLPKSLWMLEKGPVGYMVVTIPKDFWQKDREMLQKYRRYVIRKLKRLGIRYGKVRYHWAGDKNRCFYPHLNILMGAGWLGKDILDELKSDCAKWFGVNGQVVIEYHYTKSVKKIMHWIRYICRPTLNLIEDVNERYLVWCSVVKRFVNDVEWGKPGFNTIQVVLRDTDLSELSQSDRDLFWLFLSICPYCRRKLKWKRLKDGDLNDVVFRKILDCGYEEIFR